jgi:hypothetical protein
MEFHVLISPFLVDIVRSFAAIITVQHHTCLNKVFPSTNCLFNARFVHNAHQGIKCKHCNVSLTHLQTRGM